MEEKTEGKVFTGKSGMVKLVEITVGPKQTFIYRIDQYKID